MAALRAELSSDEDIRRHHDEIVFDAGLLRRRGSGPTLLTFATKGTVRLQTEANHASVSYRVTFTQYFWIVSSLVAFPYLLWLATPPLIFQPDELQELLFIIPLMWILFFGVPYLITLLSFHSELRRVVLHTLRCP